MSFGYIPHPVFWKDTILKVVGWPHFLRRMQVGDLMQLLGPRRGDRILDVGCSMGNLAFEIARKGASVEAVDFDIHPLTTLAARKMRKLHFRTVNGKTLPYPAKHFNKIVLSSVLQVVDDDERLLRECHRVLVDDGIIVGSVPRDYAIVRKLTGWSKAMIRKRFNIPGKEFYTPKQIEDLCRQTGFELTVHRYAPRRFGNWLFQMQLATRIKLGMDYFGWGDLLLLPVAILDRMLPPTNQNDGEFVFRLEKK